VSFKFVSKFQFIQHTLLNLAKWRVSEKLEEILPHLRITDKILDIGTGNAVLCQKLREKKYRVIPLDIKNLSFTKEVKPVLYDGTNIPFKDKYFDVALLITMLHHTPLPEKILSEAKRVAKKIIIIEEIYSNSINRYMTYFIDSLFNFEFSGHPHTNKTDAGWKEAFDRLELKLLHSHYTNSAIILQRVTYVLEG